MIRDSEIPEYLKLLSNTSVSEASTHPLPASLSPGAEEVTASGMEASGSSWVRCFFEESLEHGTCRCLLAPDPSAKSSQPHTALISNELRVLKRHVTENVQHASAYDVFRKKKAAGLSSEAAAKLAIESAAEKAEKMKFSFARDPAAEKSACKQRSPCFAGSRRRASPSLRWKVLTSTRIIRCTTGSSLQLGGACLRACLPLSIIWCAKFNKSV